MIAAKLVQKTGVARMVRIRYLVHKNQENEWDGNWGINGFYSTVYTFQVQSEVARPTRSNAKTWGFQGVVRRAEQ